jgi:hypothetical protein
MYLIKYILREFSVFFMNKSEKNYFSQKLVILNHLMIALIIRDKIINEWKGPKSMLPQKRLQSLQNKKAIIVRSIEDAERSPYQDATILRHLKKQKLEISELISGIRSDDDQLRSIR